MTSSGFWASVLFFVLWGGCTAELTINGQYPVSPPAVLRPVVAFVALSNNSYVATNLTVTNVVTGGSGAISNVYVSVGGGPYLVAQGSGPYTCAAGSLQAGPLSLSVYAVDSAGLHSLTNTIQVMVSVPGFVQINPGALTAVSKSSIALADLDNDGDLDLVLAGHNGTGPVAKLYRNDGQGGFTEINPGSLTGVNWSSVALGDLDGNGSPDLVLTGHNGSSPVSKVYTNNGSGAFTEIYPGSLPGVYYSSVALGDTDGDGDLDLILTGSIVSTVIARSYKNIGGGQFSEHNPGSISGVATSSVLLGDLDGDGDQDLVLLGDGNGPSLGILYRNDGSGLFAEINPGSIPGVYWVAASLGDLDGDGDPDLILTGTTGSDRIARIYRNNGSGGFMEINAGSLSGVSGGATVLGDLDGDGDLDLVLAGYDGVGMTRIYLNAGNGSFAEVAPGSLQAVYYASMALGDLDGDGDLDLVVTGEDSGTPRAVVYKNTWNRGGYPDHGKP